MVYNFNGKNIKIPDEEIKKNMEILDLSQEEAIQLYLEDEGYLENEEVAELTKKAKDSGIMSTIHGAKSDKPKAKATREPKANPLKAEIIEKIAELIRNEYDYKAKVTNSTKIIEFTCENKHFKLDLIQKREKKVK